MAIDLCSETSPRISFSHDLCQSDITTTTTTDLTHTETPGFEFPLKISNSDFEFQFGIFEQEFSSADELFSGGFLLPMQISKRAAAAASPKQPHVSKSLPPRPHSSLSEDRLLKEIVLVNDHNSKTQEQKLQEVNSFWSFKRSTSLNSGDQQQQGSKKSFITSIPLLLRRSNSTGSVPNVKKQTSKQNAQILAKSASAHTTSAANMYTYKMHHQKVQVKKNYGGRISPVLNVPPPYISKSTANLFGLGSFFSNAKDKKNKRAFS